MFELLDAPEIEPVDPKTEIVSPHPCKGKVTFDHVQFGYDPNIPVIKDFSLNVKPGEMIAIVGPTGAGKTTLVNLLMRFYDINAGSIAIDGYNTALATRNNVRQNFGMVLQDTWLFSGTIRDNIAYGKPDATDEELEALHSHKCGGCSGCGSEGGCGSHDEGCGCGGCH